MARIKDSAICIRHLDWSETSQIVVLLTEQHGMLRGLAKGSKRTSPSAIERFSGGIELLTQGEIIAKSKASEGLAILTEWNLENDYYPFRRKLQLQRFAMFGADVAGALVADHDPHPKSYRALSSYLDALTRTIKHNKIDNVYLAAATLIFQWLMLDDAGYRPSLITDAQSGEILPDNKTYIFDPIAGGLTESPTPGREDWKVRKKTVQMLRLLDEMTEHSYQDKTSETEKTDKEFQEIHEVISGMDMDSLTRGNKLLCAYLRALLDKELPTMQWVL
ncbi:DNA repair protein RecO [Poriferisphaera sp. WC338]|uniref:DNA repair protein RecO n=1 Tax=Poriferisphaera sp. WC338 TaxID=3425129 RepID=UPI003D81A5B6